MATFLDFSLLQGATSIFGFLLVFCLVYGVLSFSKVLGLSSSMISIIAVSLAFLSILSPGMLKVIQIVTPWYMLLLFVVIMVLLITGIFGGLGKDAKEISGFMGKQYGVVVNWILILSLIILVAGVGQVYLGGGESQYALNPDGTPQVVNGTYVSADSGTAGVGNVAGKGSSAFLEALFHPKIIGVIALMLIATFTVMFLGKGVS